MGIGFRGQEPYELAEVNEAFVQLRTRGMDPTKGLLKTLGDTSAAMGQPIMQAVEAVADAVTGENERLKAFGITASKTATKSLRIHQYCWKNRHGLREGV